MSRYRKTKLYSRPNAPLSSHDLIQRQSQWESEIDALKEQWHVPEAPKAFIGNLKKSVGLLNLFKTAVMEFRP